MLSTTFLSRDEVAASASPGALPPSLVSSAASSVVSLVALEERHLRKAEQVELRQENVEESQDVEDEEDADPFQSLMNRGDYLRQLRLMALEDERERQECCEAEDCSSVSSSCSSGARLEDVVTTVPGTKDKVLDYGSYLAHQRYYDDLKHIDMRYIDYGPISPNDSEGEGSRLVVEQRKELGKGGVCWDAAFMLGEHVISKESEWNSASADGGAPRVVELGAGTGLCGLMVAKASRCRVEITDLPELAGLMSDNVRRNFGSDVGHEEDEKKDDDEPSPLPSAANLTTQGDARARGTVSSRVLRWGVEEDYGRAPYDVIIGADIVTSLYDPLALARTLHALSGPDTRIYVSGKSRLDKPHEEFEEEMGRLFGVVEKVEPVSRLRSPNVFVIVAGGRR